MPNTPIVNAGFKYVNQLGLFWLTNTTIELHSGQVRDSTNTNDLVLSNDLTISSTSVGVNGVDVAVAVASTFYAVYIIGDSTDYKSTAAVLSLNGISPSLPKGYDMFKRVGWVLTDSSANILKFWQYAQFESAYRVMYYDVGIAVTTANVTSFTAVSLAAAVPAATGNKRVLLSLTYTPNSAGNVAQFLPYGSTATNGIVRFGCGVAAAQVGEVVVPIAYNGVAATVLYKLAASDTLTTLVTGYEDYL